MLERYVHLFSCEHIFVFLVSISLKVEFVIEFGIELIDYSISVDSFVE